MGLALGSEQFPWFPHTQHQLTPCFNKLVPFARRKGFRLRVFKVISTLSQAASLFNFLILLQDYVITAWAKAAPWVCSKHTRPRPSARVHLKHTGLPCRPQTACPPQERHGAQSPMPTSAHSAPTPCGQRCYAIGLSSWSWLLHAQAPALAAVKHSI